MDRNTTQVVMHFLAPKDLGSLARPCKKFRHEAIQNACIVVTEHVCWGTATPGMNWDTQTQTSGQQPCFAKHYTSTKKNALTLAKTLQEDSKVFAVSIGFVRDFHELSWMNYDERENYRETGKWIYKWEC